MAHLRALAALLALPLSTLASASVSFAISGDAPVTANTTASAKTDTFILTGASTLSSTWPAPIPGTPSLNTNGTAIETATLTRTVDPTWIATVQTSTLATPTSISTSENVTVILPSTSTEVLTSTVLHNTSATAVIPVVSTPNGGNVTSTTVVLITPSSVLGNRTATGSHVGSASSTSKAGLQNGAAGSGKLEGGVFGMVVAVAAALV